VFDVRFSLNQTFKEENQEKFISQKASEIFQFVKIVDLRAK